MAISIQKRLRLQFGVPAFRKQAALATTALGTALDFQKVLSGSEPLFSASDTAV